MKNFKIGDKITRVPSVSYTHLDVYKRQLFHGIIFSMQEKILLYGKYQRTFCMVKKIILPLMERYLNCLLYTSRLTRLVDS